MNRHTSRATRGCDVFSRTFGRQIREIVAGDALRDYGITFDSEKDLTRSGLGTAANA
jgi:hypothetical protein